MGNDSLLINCICVRCYFIIESNFTVYWAFYMIDYVCLPLNGMDVHSIMDKVDQVETLTVSNLKCIAISYRNLCTGFIYPRDQNKIHKDYFLTCLFFIFFTLSHVKKRRNNVLITTLLSFIKTDIQIEV